MHRQRFAFSNSFSVFVWTGKNYLKTLRVDANFFEDGEKKLRFQTKTDMIGQGLNNRDDFLKPLDL